MIPSIEEGLLKRIKNGAILDFGCGKGIGMRRFFERGWTTTGLDPELNGLENAKPFGQVVCGVGESVPFMDETFDVIISSQVLHHMVDPQRGLQEIFRCLKPSGYLLLAETVDNNPLLRLTRNIYPYYDFGTPIRSRYTRQRLRYLIQAAHFMILEEYVWGLLFWMYIDLSKRSKTLARIPHLLPFLMDGLETHLMMKAKHLREYCLQYYVLACKYPNPQ